MKIKCEDCKNELERKCLVSKETINITKSRKCNDYEEDQQREIIRLEHKARVLDQQEAAVKVKMEAFASAQQEASAEEVAHPTTGDLSRFTTTAT